MRLLLLRFVIVAVISIAVWVFAGPRVSALLDRVHTVAGPSLPLGNYELDAQQFIIGPKRWILGANALIANDARGRMTLSSDGRTFAFGAVDGGHGATPGAYFQFHPDPGDQISFTQHHSGLSWPTLPRFSVFQVPRSSWKRHNYRELHWIKPSGASITMVWRDGQSFFAASGWTDDNLEIAPAITISAMPSEAAIVSYLTANKTWQRDSYRLEYRGRSDDGSCDVVAVNHIDDDHATTPGAGRSVQLCLDMQTHAVVRELASQ